MSFILFLVLQVLVFFALMFLLRRMLSHNLTDAAAHLQALSAEYTRRQEELKKRVEQAEQQYGEQMTQAKTAANQLVTKAKQDAESSRLQMLEEARLESERIIQQGLGSRDALRKELEQAMELRAIERACELLQEALPEAIREAIQSRWIDELFRNGFAHLEHLRDTEQAGEVKVVAAFSLSPEQQQRLQQRLQEALGRPVVMTAAVDPTLVSGLMITLGSVVLDGSLASKVKQAARHAQNIS